ncbi:hypothetical protein GCM10010909_12440 [Acidocella aquatica]|uniref:SH3 domain-containing protein n=1 Tax=Acidocella aquatica TaxID=1922313 RepID=A0ABQ6A262_9PROT|nr:SH3 domain-containing protein [Acidocella aquatica]GLR66564.1 hypothetical protein GCM10010909_12440 [Acidocella aquatica]
MKKLFLTAAMLASFVPATVLAQQATPSHAATVLSGYACMALNLPAGEMMNPDIQVPIYSDPTSSSTQIGRASAIVIVSFPLVLTDGYARVLHLNGKTGWISEKYIKTWVNPGGTGDHCYPVLLSNGRIGFEFHK